MEKHSKEIKVIIADLKKYLAKLDKYTTKPLSGQNYHEIHQYNVGGVEYERFASLMEQLNPLDRDELNKYFCAISECSHPFASYHVAAENHEQINSMEFTCQVDLLKKTRSHFITS